ncbi:MAG: hypothetical protein AAFR98_13010 [Pseudomonadota bacterium]
MNDRISDQYAFFQLAKALKAGNVERSDKWRDVLACMATGDLSIGSRTPVAGMPVWAMPEVERGGFATGAFAAGGELREHERALAQEMGISFRDIPRIRSALNAWHLSDDGLAHLGELALSGRFDAETPEETALLCVALLRETAPLGADIILDEITPYFDRLRFFPIVTAAPWYDGVHVRTVGQLRDALRRAKPSRNVLQQNATLTI